MNHSYQRINHLWRLSISVCDSLISEYIKAKCVRAKMKHHAVSEGRGMGAEEV